MRILNITDFYWPFLGGVEQHVRSLSGELANRGHAVAVVTLGNEELPSVAQDGAVQVHRLRSTTQRLPWLFRHPQRPWAPPAPDPEIVRRLRTVIAEFQPDIVHGHDWLARSFLPLKAESHAKFVVSLHYYTLACAKKNLMYQDQPCTGPALRKCMSCAAAHYGVAKGVPVAWLSQQMASWERRAVDLFLPVSQVTAEKNGLPTAGVSFTVIPNFLPPHREISSGAHVTIDLDPYLAQLPAEPYFMFVGDLRRQKGLDLLLDAYRRLQNSLAPAQVPPLVLIGKVWDETPQSFPPNVIVLQEWPNEAVLAAWSRALAAVVPSIWDEPFGIVVIEAMSCGCPVIGAQIGGIPDMVRHEETGLLVPPNDAVCLQQAMQRLLLDESLRTRLGTAARHHAQQYTARAVVPRIEAAYAGLLDTASAHAARFDEEPTSAAVEAGRGDGVYAG